MIYEKRMLWLITSTYFPCLLALIHHTEEADAPWMKQPIFLVSCCCCFSLTNRSGFFFPSLLSLSRLFSFHWPFVKPINVFWVFRLQSGVDFYWFFYFWLIYRHVLQAFKTTINRNSHKLLFLCRIIIFFRVIFNNSDWIMCTNLKFLECVSFIDEINIQYELLSTFHSFFFFLQPKGRKG